MVPFHAKMCNLIKGLTSDSTGLRYTSKLCHVLGNVYETVAMAMFLLFFPKFFVLFTDSNKLDNGHTTHKVISFSKSSKILGRQKSWYIIYTNDLSFDYIETNVLKKAMQLYFYFKSL